MKHIYTTILVGLVVFPSITFAQVPSESLHMNNRWITWNSTQTNGSFDVQWARSVDGPWHDTWDTMMGVPATNGVIKVEAPHFFRVVYRPLPANAVDSYLGYRWNCYRTEWDVGKNGLSSLPKAREGFNYGAGGDGRGATITSHENDAAWDDYTVEFDLYFRGIDPSFNPHGVDLNYRGGSFLFRVKSMNETWYKAGRTHYSFSFEAHGFNLLRYNDNDYGTGGDPTVLLSNSQFSTDMTGTNHVKISCIGNVISAWVNGNFFGSVTDDSESSLDHGGVGFHMYHECMMNCANMKITHLTEE